MTTLLPQDVNDNPIPAMRLKQAKAHSIAFSDTSARNATAFDTGTRIISVYADAPVYLAFGGADVNATTNDHYFPSGIYYDMAIGGDDSAQFTHVAALQVSGSGTVYISEKE